MDGAVRAQQFETNPYRAVCCTHCGYDMGYDHINTTGMKKSIDYVTCPECFTEQDKTAANYAPPVGMRPTLLNGDLWLNEQRT